MIKKDFYNLFARSLLISYFVYSLFTLIYNGSSHINSFVFLGLQSDLAVLLLFFLILINIIGSYLFLTNKYTKLSVISLSLYLVILNALRHNSDFIFSNAFSSISIIGGLLLSLSSPRTPKKKKVDNLIVGLLQSFFRNL